MATPTVTLTFEGDTTQLDQAFNTTSAGADRMASSVEASSRKVGDSSGALDRVGESADGAESKFIGFADVVAGAGDTMTAFSEGDVVGMAMGLADMAGGIAAFVIPVLGTVATAIGTAATAVWGFTTALLANPITWVVVGIVALIAAIVLLIVYWDDVKAAAVAAANWIADRWNELVGTISDIASRIYQWIADKIGGAWEWVQQKALEFWNWLSGLPGMIGQAFASIAQTLSAPFRSAFNAIADVWNNTVGQLSWTVPDWVPLIGGNTISVPKLPHFHTGGLVPGTQGSEMLAVLQAGERVLPRGAPSDIPRGDTYVTVLIDGQEFKGMMRTEIRESNRSTRSAALAGRSRA